MVAPVVNVNGALIGVHKTFLQFDGKFAFQNPRDQRECRGVIAGGVIRLADYDPDRALVVGEGIETTLSAMQLLRLPGWSAIYAGGLLKAELPPEVQHIVIAADRDESGTGQRNAAEAGRRRRAEGRAVRIVMPITFGDFNDVLRRGG
jgi:phage/plasmid primase-like uncharacterized protein